MRAAATPTARTTDPRTAPARAHSGAPWLFLPVLGAPLAHAPVLRYDLLPALKRPIDAGRTLGGARIFGDNKTWRGAAVMFAGVLGASAALHRVDAYHARLPPGAAAAGPLTTGALLGIAAVAGELPNSFLKRRLRIAPGARRVGAAGVALSVLDQADFVLAAWLLLAPVHRMSVREAATAFATVAAIHVPLNLVGYATGVRSTPI